MKISKIKAAWALLTGGVEGLVEYLLGLFNELLQKIDPKEMYRYCGVVKAIATCLRTIFDLFKDKIGEAKTAAINATIKALDDLAAALEDGKYEKHELDQLIDNVKQAIEAWKKAK